MAKNKTAEAIESQIAAIDCVNRQIEELGQVPNDVIDYATYRTIVKYLVELRNTLKSDLKKFESREG